MNIKITAPLVLRAYAWELIKANTGLSEKDYGNKNPIVPLGEEPDIKKFGKPYLVYAYAEQTPTGNSARNVGNMAFAVNSTSFSSISDITTILARAFERADQSALDVNEFSSTVPQFVGLRFGTIELSFVDVDQPEESEGGEKQGVVNVRYEYYANYDGLVTSLAHWDGKEYKRN